MALPYTYYLRDKTGNFLNKEKAQPLFTARRPVASEAFEAESEEAMTAVIAELSLNADEVNILKIPSR